MTINRLAIIALLITLPTGLASQSAFAQAKKGPSPAPQPKTFTIDFSEATAGGLPVTLNATLREARIGAAVRQTEIEVCFSASPAARRIDRFNTILTLRDGAWRGVATTSLDKAPVEIVLQRSGKPDALNFTGEIKLGGNLIKFDQKEASFIEEDSPPDANASFEVARADDPDVSLNTVSIIVRPSAIGAVIPLLRKHRAEVKTEYLIANCEALRTNEHNIVVTVDPAHATALVNEANIVAGVIRSGWTGGTTVIGDAVRFPAAAYLVNGAVSRDKLFETLGAAIAKALGQQVAQKPELSETSGVVTLYFAGQGTSVPGAGLKDATEVNLLVAPEGLKSQTQLVVYIDDIDRSIEDESKGLSVVQDTRTEGGENDSGIRRVVQAAIAQALGGEIWDDEKRAWVKR